MEVAGPDELRIEGDARALERRAVTIQPGLAAQDGGAPGDGADPAVPSVSRCSVAARPPAQLAAPIDRTSGSGWPTGSTMTTGTWSAASRLRCARDSSVRTRMTPSVRLAARLLSQLSTSALLRLSALGRQRCVERRTAGSERSHPARRVIGRMAVPVRGLKGFSP